MQLDTPHGLENSFSCQEFSSQYQLSIPLQDQKYGSFLQLVIDLQILSLEGFSSNEGALVKKNCFTDDMLVLQNGKSARGVKIRLGCLRDWGWGWDRDWGEGLRPVH